MSLKGFSNLFFLTSLTLTSSLSLAKGVYETKPQGFLWYTELKPLAKEKKPSFKKRRSLSREEEAYARNKALKKKLEDAIQVVLDEPTLDHAIQAQYLQRQVMERSEEVSKVWVLAALQGAGLTSPETNPNVLDRMMRGEKKKAQDLITLKKLAKEWGLFLYVVEGCAFCERFVPIVKEIQDETGFQVLVISKEGGSYGPFEARRDTGLMHHLNPEGWAPVLYLVHQDGRRLYPVARGLTDRNKIKENILLMKRLDNQRFSAQTRWQAPISCSPGADRPK